MTCTRHTDGNGHSNQQDLGESKNEAQRHLQNDDRPKLKRPQGFPPGFDLVQPGGISRLVQETDAWECESPQLNIPGLVNPEIIQDEDQTPLRPNLDHLVEEIQEVLTAMPKSAMGQIGPFSVKGTTKNHKKARRT